MLRAGQRSQFAPAEMNPGKERLAVDAPIGGNVSGDCNPGRSAVHRRVRQRGDCRREIDELHRRIKAALDPEGLLNPGKFLD